MMCKHQFLSIESDGGMIHSNCRLKRHRIEYPTLYINAEKCICEGCDPRAEKR